MTKVFYDSDGPYIILKDGDHKHFDNLMDAFEALYSHYNLKEIDNSEEA